MRLRTAAPKAGDVWWPREMRAEQTYERMLPHLRRVGITRIADITGLDRVGIPVFSAMCPRSRDIISVYNGKGTTVVAAKTSAIMEAVERFAAAHPRPPAAVASYTELEESGRAVLDPREQTLELHPNYRLDLPISWTQGYDVMNDRDVLVPMSLAGYYVSWSETPCVTIATTNGLASGNSLEEAICHALAELIERDDWTIADLVSNRLSRVLAHDTGAALWLQDLNPSIDVTTLPEAPRQLAERFVAAGLTVELKNLTSANCLPTILASVSEAIAPSFSHSHHGVGTHPDVEVAATRALTEVAQSRAVDISAVREDISLPGDDVGSWLLHIKRTGEVDHEAWAFRRSARAISISSLPSHRNDDIAADIRLMLERLQASGLTQVIVVDLSLPDTPASVVRAIVPGLESWTVDHSRVGSRARAAVASALSKLLPNAETVPPPER